MQALPEWLRQEIPAPDILAEMNGLESRGVGTVCASARCPNFGRCLKERRVTFIILGPVCTRLCLFCAVNKHGAASAVDPEEPARISGIVREFGITHAVVTSVTRDDLSDGGAGQFAAVVREIRRDNPGVTIELLVPDFGGDGDAFETAAASRPEVFAHNLETVPRLYPGLRPGAEYDRSLDLIRHASRRGLVTKSSFMLGLGEREDELLDAMSALARAGCSILTLGQYLSPSPDHARVVEFVTPEKFRRLGDAARLMGFGAVLSGALVRSSYRAGEVYRETIEKRVAT